ncbi:4-phosphoerythronate dehydrogenase (FAD-dependent) [Cohaesibacter sp. ES.047]|uniref:FAD-binding oxidoreductase n=1 Tax=Cohaesibacter sp. ES.047 TaxID=1798205 RepID=UPI000BC06858|nr:FAD-binding oxidoreductase [Cohaesibacter sp. ES.047]SNY92489.1 4-phosphoerythronate dehydrogenase (FAD-dependent) [Cohaesibacter sp. ES.047]
MTSKLSPPANEASSGLAPDVLDDFKALIGEQHCLTEPADIAPYCREWRNKFFGICPLVLRPGNTDEVSAIMTLAYARNVAIVPQGGNTGLVGGQITDQSNAQVIVSLERLKRIRSLDIEGNVAVVEAGVVLETVQKAAEEADRFFPLALGAQGSCQIGGNLSTNAGGTSVLAYGNARDMVLGLEVVLPDGRIMRGLRSLRKDNTGYDLKHLFIGAEGTLGIITAASLKLYPLPRDRQVALAGIETPRDALRIFNIARSRVGSMLTGFELMPRIGMEFAVRHLEGARDPLVEAHPWYCLLELSIGSDAINGRELMETMLEEAFDADLIRDAVLAENTRQMQDIWHIRHGLSEVQKEEGGSIKHDISVPTHAIPDFLDRAIPACLEAIPGCRPVAFGHLGDGNLHFNISQPIGADRDAFLNRWEEINAMVHAIVADLEGSISAEHGIGVLKRDLLPGVKDPVELELMHQIKTLLDPKGLMNPGKVLQ